MTKLYAVVSPATIWTPPKDDLDCNGCCTDPIVAIWHKINYEQVCGYSLGHNAQFYPTLETAQQNCGLQHAIVELDTRNDAIARFAKLHTSEEVTKKNAPVPGHPGFFAKHTYVEWISIRIKKDDVTAGALEELNRQYRDAENRHNIQRP